MIRFFFDVHDGRDIVDDLGQELASVAEARQYALLYGGCLIKDLDAGFWEEDEWRIVVRDDVGHTFFSLLLTSQDANASSVAA